MSSNFNIMRYFIFISFVCECTLAANTTLKLVSVVFRHGDRTPVPPGELYPNDPYKKYNFDPPGYGKLTKSGEWRMYNFGKFLRSLYNDFLPIDYIPGTIEVRSTDVNRTIESVKFVLSALYPNVSIPVNFKTNTKNRIFLPKFCLRYKMEYKKAKEMPDIKKELGKLDNFKKNISQWTGKKMETADHMNAIYSTLETEKFMNLTLPSWTNGVYPNGDLLKAKVLAHKIQNYNENMKRMNGGMLIRKFTEDMKSVRNDSMVKTRKLMLYSAHDITVVAVMHALDVYYPHAPQYSSAVIVELHFISQDFFVKISHYLGVPAEIKDLTIPGCTILCPLDKFISLLQNVTQSLSCAL